VSDGSNSPKIVLALIEKGKKFLLIKRKVAGITELRWAFPGGTVGDAETNEQAVLRHAKAEVGQEVEIKEKLLERIHPDTQFSVSYFYCIPSTNSSAEVGEPHEIDNVEWVAANEVTSRFTTNVDPEIKKFLSSFSSPQ